MSDLNIYEFNLSGYEEYTPVFFLCPASMIPEDWAAECREVISAEVQRLVQTPPPPTYFPHICTRDVFEAVVAVLEKRYQRLRPREAFSIWWDIPGLMGRDDTYSPDSGLREEDHARLMEYNHAAEAKRRKCRDR